MDRITFAHLDPLMRVIPDEEVQTPAGEAATRDVVPRDEDEPAAQPARSEDQSGRPTREHARPGRERA